MMALARHIGLSRDERMELARVLLWRDVTSWKTLDEGQVNRMLDALEGWEKVDWLLRHRTGRSSDPEPDRTP